MTLLEEIVASVNHSREKRGHFAAMVVDNPALLPELLDICERVDDNITCRASWGLEFVSRYKLDAILPHLDRILVLLPKVYRHSAVRPMAKICEYLIVSYYSKTTNLTQKYLTDTHRQQITEACFDWLITDQKVAPQAYSMTSLYLLGTEYDWIHSELRIILEKNYHQGSAAYKARSRMILDKI